MNFHSAMHEFYPTSLSFCRSFVKAMYYCEEERSKKERRETRFFTAVWVNM